MKIILAKTSVKQNSLKINKTYLMMHKKATPIHEELCT